MRVPKYGFHNLAGPLLSFWSLWMSFTSCFPLRLSWNFDSNFNQNPYFNQRPNYNYNQNRNQNPNFNQIPNPDKNFEVICYLCNTPGHTSRNCNKQININQELPQQQEQQQFQKQELNKQENSNALPGTGAQRGA